MHRFGFSVRLQHIIQKQINIIERTDFFTIQINALNKTQFVLYTPILAIVPDHISALAIERKEGLV